MALACTMRFMAMAIYRWCLFTAAALTDRDIGESFDQDADDVAGLLAHLGIGKANFLGFSNGGSTTLYIAKKYPQLVNKIVAASPLYKRDGVIAGMFDGLQQATLADMPEALKTGFLAVNPDKEKLQTMFNKDRERMLGFTDMPDSDLEAITAPALLIVADRDVITVEHLVKMCSLIPNARLVVLPGTHGSYLGTVESDLLQSSRMPEISAILIKEFLEI